MGLTVSIFRDRYRSDSNAFNGYDEVTVVNVSGPFDPTPSRPAAMLISGPGRRPNPVLVPAFRNGNGEFVAGVISGTNRMFGGTLAYTSDSRWHRAVESLGGVGSGAVSVHDRFEGKPSTAAAENIMDLVMGGVS